MTEKIVDFPERRKSIPCNVPDIGCLQTIECLKCGSREWSLLAKSGEPIEEVACRKCNFRMRLHHPTFCEPIE